MQQAVCVVLLTFFSGCLQILCFLVEKFRRCASHLSPLENEASRRERAEGNTKRESVYRGALLVILLNARDIVSLVK